MQVLQHCPVIQRWGIKLVVFSVITVLLSRTGWGHVTHITGTRHCWQPCTEEVGLPGEEDMRHKIQHWFSEIFVPTPLSSLKSKLWRRCREESINYILWKMQINLLLGFFWFCFVFSGFFLVLLVLVSSAIINLCLHSHVERQSIPSAVELETWRSHCAILACWLAACPAIHNLPSTQWSPREHCFHQ